MNHQLKTVLKNSGYAIVANLLSLIVSTLVVLVLPKLIGVESYGYWQLYLFYTSYVGFFHFGWIDGIYLKYGGEHYEHLDKDYFYSQFITYIFFQLIFAILIFAYGRLLVSQVERGFIFRMLAVTLVLTNVRYFTVYLLQTTNLIKESSRITILDRLLYVFLLLVMIIFGTKNYHGMLYADVAARLVSVLYGIYLCRQVLLLRWSSYRLNLAAVVDNIQVGSNLMLANVASMLIIGVVRLGIEHRWDIATFGRVSLTLSLSNLMMTFINAIGIVIFPMLRRLDPERLPNLYIKLRYVLVTLMLGLLVLYYPLRPILLAWLPDYGESLRYMSLVFPMAVFEGKMSLLINTYLKALRMEKYILKINLFVVSLSLGLTLLTTILLQQLELAVLSIVLLLAVRSSLAEMVLTKTLKIDLQKDLLLELTLTIIFIGSSWFLGTRLAALVYCSCYATYLYMKRNLVLASYHQLINLIKRRRA